MELILQLKWSLSAEFENFWSKLLPLLSPLWNRTYKFISFCFCLSLFGKAAICEM